MRYAKVGIVALVLCILATPLAAQAQRQKVHRIGWLLAVPSSSTPTVLAVASFMQTLRDLGYVEGQNLVVHYRYKDRPDQTLSVLAAELVNLPVDVIVTDTSDATRAAQQATKTIPIVMTVSAAPVEQGFVASLARPGGNITGLSMVIPELARKRLELVRDLVPKATRVAVLGPPLTPNSALQWQDTEAAARLLGLTMQRLELQGPSFDFERAFDAASRERADALVLLPDALVAPHSAEIVALAAKRRGLMSYGPSIDDMFVRSAVYVDKILKGAKPGDLPVEQPTKFDLIINMKTAAALGITVPMSILSLAETIR